MGRYEPRAGGRASPAMRTKRIACNATVRIAQTEGQLQLDDPGVWGNAGNRISASRGTGDFYSATESSLAGSRSRRGCVSRISNKAVYGTKPGTAERTIRDRAAVNNRRDSRENLTSVMLPGVGLLYRLADETVLLGGVHKGFTAPSNAEGVREESALNWEFGFRTVRNNSSIEAVAFLSDYDNLLGECTASSGTDCEVGDAFNGDAATVKGLELVASTGFAVAGSIHIPATLAYTYIDGTFDTDVADTSFFGDVSAGDPLPLHT